MRFRRVLLAYENTASTTLKLKGGVLAGEEEAESIVALAKRFPTSARVTPRIQTVPRPPEREARSAFSVNT